jgi:UDP-2-acetamido-3-amino-2,3-dideoxy-glucuronate N-acetyltransferase
MMSEFDTPPPYLQDMRAATAFVHESSWVDAPCQIGEHTSVLHFSHIMGHTVIGNFCHIGRHVSIASGVLLGDHVQVLDNSRLNSGVIFENEVICGPGSQFVESKHVRAASKGISKVSPTLVRHGARLGANSTIMAGITIGRAAFVEAGTVVDSNIPDFAVVCGNPLKIAGWRCECGQTLAFNSSEQTACETCGRRYGRQSKWKMQLLTQKGAFDAGYSDPQPDSSIRTT